MQATSETWRRLWAAGAALEARAVIGGVAYGGVAPVITRALMQSGPQIGNAVSASCEVALRGVSPSAVPRSAEVVIQTRLTDGETASEWLPAGTFYLSRRAWDPVAGRLTLVCFDALLKADAPWEPSGGDWPRDAAAVAGELAVRLGLELDGRTGLTEGAWFVDEPEAGATIRDALGRIGQLAGGNWIVTPAGRLRLVPFAPEAPEPVTVEAVLGGVDAGEASAVTGIRCGSGDGTALVGDDSGVVLDVSLPPVRAAELLERLAGAAYAPFTLSNAVCDPAAELGDAVRYGGAAFGILCAETASLGPAFRASLSAPEGQEIGDEYPYIGSAQRTLIAAKAAAREAVNDLDEGLTQQEIFNRLTDNGAAQGLVLLNGQLFINANYMKLGTLDAAEVEVINLNADNLVTGRVRADQIDLSSYNQLVTIPDENNPSSLFIGQSVVDGWITGRTNLRIARLSDATDLAGATLSVSLLTKAKLTSYGADYSFSSSADPDSGYSTSEEVVLPPAKTKTNGTDSAGNLVGPTLEGEGFRFNFAWTLPTLPQTISGVEYDRMSVSLHVLDAGGVKQITVSVEANSGFEIRYGNSIGFGADGLQVGKFVVDHSGNVTANGGNAFNGPVSMTDAPTLGKPLAISSGGTGATDAAAARNSLGITPANIGAVAKTGGYFTGSIGMDTGDDYDTAPSAIDYNSGFGFVDSNRIWRGGLYSVRNTNGSYATMLATRFQRASGSIVFARFGPMVDNAGNVSYLVDSPAALRSAIGAVTLSDVIVAYGTKEFGSVEAGAMVSETISIGITMPNTNYIVITQSISPNFGVGVQSKTRTQFNLFARNLTVNTGTGTVTWAVIKLPD